MMCLFYGPPPPKKKKRVADPFLRFESVAFLFEFAFLCGKMHVRIYLIEIEAGRGLIAGRLLLNGIRIVLCWQCLDARQPGSDLSNLYTWQFEIFKGVWRKAYLNALKVFNICLELPCDSEKYFGILALAILNKYQILQDRLDYTSVRNPLKISDCRAFILVLQDPCPAAGRLAPLFYVSRKIGL